MWNDTKPTKEIVQRRMAIKCVRLYLAKKTADMCEMRTPYTQGGPMRLTVRIATIECSCCVSLIAPLVRVDMYETLDINAVVKAQEVVIAAPRKLHPQKLIDFPKHSTPHTLYLPICSVCHLQVFLATKSRRKMACT